ncbi:MAG: hypothetical protein NVSMB1_21990 [Polyangiales bacterium]
MSPPRIELVKVERHRWLLPIVIAHALVMFTWATLAHRHFGSDAYDLGAYDSGFFHLAKHGRVWNAVEGVPQWSLHFEGGLLFLWLPYRLIPSPLWLFALQSACCAAVAIPIESMVREITRDRTLALVCAAATILTPQLVLPEIADFHSMLVCALPMAVLVYGIERDRPKLIVCAALALLSLREQMGLVVAVGAFSWLARTQWTRRRVIAAVTLAIVAVGCFLAEVLWLIPAFGHATMFPYVRGYGRLGGEPGTALRFAIAHPLRFIGLCFEGKRSVYLLGMPSGAVVPALLSLRWFATGWPLLVAAPLLATQLLNDRSDLFRISSHYGAPVVPLVSGAAALFISRLFAQSVTLARALSWVWMGWTLISLTVLLSPYLVGPGCPIDPSFSGSSREHALRDAMTLIPPNAAVCAQSNLVPHLTHRDLIRSWPEQVERAEFIVLDTDSGTLREEMHLQLLVAARALRIDDRYRIRLDKAGVLVAEHIR